MKLLKYTVYIGVRSTQYIAVWGVVCTICHTHCAFSCSFCSPSFILLIPTFVLPICTFILPTYTGLFHISDLYLNYNCLSDDIAQEFAAHANLETLSIKVYKNDPHYHKITSATWGKLKRGCPKLEVNLEFDQVPSYTEIAPILVPEIPLRGLYIWSGYEEEEDWRVGDTLNYVSKYFSKSLGEKYV